MADIRSSFMQSYLAQQIDMTESQSLQKVHIPTEGELEEFKAYVKSYIDIDNDVKKLKAAIRERNSVKKEISSYIMNFMSKFNIEDLNTKHGKIRYQITKVKRPMTEKGIRSKIMENYGKDMTPEDLNEKIFSEKETVERHVLKRLV